MTINNSASPRTYRRLLNSLRTATTIIVRVVDCFPIKVLCSPGMLFAMFVLALLLIMRSSLFNDLVARRRTSKYRGRLPREFLGLTRLLRIPLCPNRGNENIRAYANVLRAICSPFGERAMLMFIGRGTNRRFGVREVSFGSILGQSTNVVFIYELVVI